MSRPFNLYLLLLIGLAFPMTACSADPSAAEQAARTSVQQWAALKDFAAIDATGPDDVSVTIGTPFNVRAEGEAAAVADLDIAVKGDKLVIGRKSKGIWNWGSKDRSKGVKIFVTMPAISSVALTGAGDFAIDRVEGEALKLSLTGAGDFRADQINVGRFTADMTGAGSIKITGRAENAKLSITGAGDIDGKDLKVGTADVETLGAGDIDIASDGRVAIKITGAGDVRVKGKAQCTINSMGPGEARCAP